MEIIYRRDEKDSKDVKYVRHLADMQVAMYEHGLDVYFYYVPGSFSVSPWLGKDGKKLTDAEAVEIYGLESVYDFISDVEKKYVPSGALELLAEAKTSDGNSLYFFRIRRSGITYTMTYSTTFPVLEYATGNPERELEKRAKTEKR